MNKEPFILKDIMNDVENQNVGSPLPDVASSGFYNTGFEPLNKYDAGLRRGMDQEDFRAQKQSFWQALGNSAVQSVTEVGLGTLEGVGYLLDWEQAGNLVKGTEKEFGNWFSNIMNEGKEAVASEFPIYGGGEAFDPGNARWWMANAPSIMSSVALMVPALGAVSAVGRAGRLAKSAMGLGRIAQGAGKAAKTAQTISAQRGIGAALFSRYMENTMEASEKFKSRYEELLSEDPSMTEEAAIEQAAKDARNVWWANTANLATDIPQYMLLLKGPAAMAAAATKTRSAAGKIWDKTSNFVKMSAGEGLEEGYQYSIQKAASVSANPFETIANAAVTMPDHTSDDEFWASVTLGAAGGAVMGGLTGTVQKMVKKSMDRYNVAARAFADGNWMEGEKQIYDEAFDAILRGEGDKIMDIAEVSENERLKPMVERMMKQVEQLQRSIPQGAPNRDEIIKANASQLYYEGAINEMNTEMAELYSESKGKLSSLHAAKKALALIEANEKIPNKEELKKDALKFFGVREEDLKDVEIPKSGLMPILEAKTMHLLNALSAFDNAFNRQQSLSQRPAAPAATPPAPGATVGALPASPAQQQPATRQPASSSISQEGNSLMSDPQKALEAYEKGLSSSDNREKDISRYIIGSAADKMRENMRNADPSLFSSADEYVKAVFPQGSVEEAFKGQQSRGKTYEQHAREKWDASNKPAAPAAPPAPAATPSATEEGEMVGTLEDLLGEEKPETYGDTNSVFTKSAYEEARKKFRGTGNLTAGFDPELLQAAITMAGYHIEAGARKFSQFAKAMINDLGDSVKPYLKPAYNAIRDLDQLPPEVTEAMDDYQTVMSSDVNAVEVVEQTSPEPDQVQGDVDMGYTVDIIFIEKINVNGLNTELTERQQGSIEKAVQMAIDAGQPAEQIAATLNGLGFAFNNPLGVMAATQSLIKYLDNRIKGIDTRNINEFASDPKGERKSVEAPQGDVAAKQAEIEKIEEAKDLHTQLHREFTAHNLDKTLVQESSSASALEQEKNKWNTREEAQKAIDDEIESVSEKIEYWLAKGLTADAIVNKIMPPLTYAGNPLRFMLITGKEKIIEFIKAKAEGKVDFTLQEAHKTSEKEINAKYGAQIAALEGVQKGAEVVTQQPAQQQVATDVKAPFVGKIIYFTPGAGKSTLSKQARGVVDMDAIIIEEMTKEQGSFKRKEGESDQAMIERWNGTSMIGANGLPMGGVIGIDSRAEIDRRALAKARELAAKGHTVLTGTLSMANKVDMAFLVDPSNERVKKRFDTPEASASFKERERKAFQGAAIEVNETGLGPDTILLGKEVAYTEPQQQPEMAEPGAVSSEEFEKHLDDQLANNIKMQADGLFEAKYKPFGVGQEQVKIFDTMEEAAQWMAQKHMEAIDQQSSFEAAPEIDFDEDLSEIFNPQKEEAKEVDERQREALLSEAIFDEKPADNNSGFATPYNLESDEVFVVSYDAKITYDRDKKRYVPVVAGGQVQTYADTPQSTHWRDSKVAGTVSYDEAQHILRNLHSNVDVQYQPVYFEVDPTLPANKRIWDKKENHNYTPSEIEARKKAFFEANKSNDPVDVASAWSNIEAGMLMPGRKAADTMSVSTVVYVGSRRVPIGDVRSMVYEEQRTGRGYDSPQNVMRYELWQQWQNSPDAINKNVAVKHPVRSSFAKDSKGNVRYMAGRFLEHENKFFDLNADALKHKVLSTNRVILMVPVRQAQGNVTMMHSPLPFEGRIMNDGNYMPGFPYVLVKDTMGNYVWARVFSRTMKEAPQQAREELAGIVAPMVKAKEAFRKRLNDLGIDPDGELPADVSAEIARYNTAHKDPMLRKDARFPEVYDFVQQGYKKVESDLSSLFRWREGVVNGKAVYGPSIKWNTLFQVKQQGNPSPAQPFSLEAFIAFYGLEDRPMQIDVSKIEDADYVDSILWRMTTNMDTMSPLVSPNPVVKIDQKSEVKENEDDSIGAIKNSYMMSGRWSAVNREIRGVEDNFERSKSSYFHGTNTYELTPEGSLIFVPGDNFGGKTTSVSFTDVPAVALDYMSRKNGSTIIKIKKSALPNLVAESADEYAHNSSEALEVKKGDFEIIDMDVEFDYSKDIAKEKRSIEKMAPHKIFIKAIASNVANNELLEFQENERADTPMGYMETESIRNKAFKQAADALSAKQIADSFREAFPGMTFQEILNSEELQVGTKMFGTVSALHLGEDFFFSFEKFEEVVDLLKSYDILKDKVNDKKSSPEQETTLGKSEETRIKKEYPQSIKVGEVSIASDLLVKFLEDYEGTESKEKADEVYEKFFSSLSGGAFNEIYKYAESNEDTDQDQIVEGVRALLDDNVKLVDTWQLSLFDIASSTAPDPSTLTDETSTEKITPRRPGSANKFKRFKRVDGKAVNAIDRDKAIAWLSKRVPASIAVRFADLDADTWGYTKDALIVLSNAAPQSTAYHEAMHVVFWNLLTDTERSAIMKEAESEWGNIAPKELSAEKRQEWIEERLADAFEKYAVEKESPSGSAVKRFFDNIVKWLKAALGLESEIDAFYRKIYGGAYSRRNVVSKPFVRYSKVPGLTAQEERASINMIMTLLDERIDEAMDAKERMMASQDERRRNEFMQRDAKKIEKLRRELGEDIGEELADEQVFSSDISEEYKKVLSLQTLLSSDGLLGMLMWFGQPFEGWTPTAYQLEKLESIIKGLDASIQSVNFEDSTIERKVNKQGASIAATPGPLYFKILQSMSERGIKVKMKGDKLSMSQRTLEDAEDIVEFEEQSEEREWWTMSSVSISPKEQMTPRLRRWLSRLPKLLDDGTQAVDMFGFGVEQTLSPSEIYPALQQIMGNAIDVNDMMEKLNEEAQSNPLFSSIVETLSSWQTDQNANLLATQLFTHIAQNGDPDTMVVRQNIKEGISYVSVFPSGSRKESRIASGLFDGIMAMPSAEIKTLNESMRKMLREAKVVTHKDIRDALERMGYAIPASSINKIPAEQLKSILYRLNSAVAAMAQGNHDDSSRTLMDVSRKNIAPYVRNRVQDVFMDVAGSKVYAWSRSSFIVRQMNRFAKDFASMRDFYANDPAYTTSNGLIPLLQNTPSEPWQLVFTDGIKQHGQRKGKQYSKFSSRDMLVTLLHYFNSDIYALPVLSDSPVFAGVRIKRNKDVESSVAEIMSMMEAEWNRMNANAGDLAGTKNYDKNKSSASIFARFLMKEGKPIDSFDRAAIENEVRNYISEKASQIHGDMKKLNIIRSGTNNGMLDARIVDPLAFVTQMVASHMAVHPQLVMLTMGDPSFYGGIGDFYKRAKELSSPGTFINDKAKFTHSDGSVTDLSAKPSMQIMVLKDIEVDTEIAEDFDRVKEGLSGKMKGFSLTDGQSFIDPVSLMEREIGLGRWTSEKDNIKEILMRGELPRAYGIDMPFNAFKPYTFTLLKEKDGRIRPFQKKDSEAIIYPFYGRKYVSGKKNPYYNSFHRVALEQMGYSFKEEGKLGDANTVVSYDAANRKADVISFDTAIKVGAKNPGTTEGTTIVDGHIESIPMGDWRLQQETPSHHIDSDVIYGTQTMKMIVDGLKDDANYLMPDGSFIKGVDLKTEYYKQISKDINASFKDVEKLFTEAKESEEGFQRLVSTLRQQVIDRGMPERFAQSLETVRRNDGTLDTLLPMGHPIHGGRMESMIFSFIRKKVSKRKFKKGYSFVNASPIGFERAPRIVFNEDGSVAYYEAYAPIHDRKLLKYVNKDGYIDADGMKEIESDPEMSKLLKGLVYRIPTEGKYSMFPIKIIGFLPTDDGVIYMPPEIVAISGLDFDIDKVRGFFYAVGSKISRNEKSDNRKLDLMLAAMTTKDVVADMLTPGDFQALSDTNASIRQAKMIDKGIESDKKMTHRQIDEIDGAMSIIDPMSIVTVSRRMNAGKDLVGIAAMNNVVHALWNQNFHAVTKDRVPIQYQHKVKVDTPSGTKMLNEVGAQTDVEGVPVSRNIAMTLAAFVDNGKNPQAEFFNANDYTASAIYYLLHVGVDLETVQLFMANPMISRWVDAYYNNGESVTREMKAYLKKGAQIMKFPKAGFNTVTLYKDMLKDALSKKDFESKHKNMSWEYFNFSVLASFVAFNARGNDVTALAMATKVGDKGAGPSQVENIFHQRAVDKIVNDLESPFPGHEHLFQEGKYMYDFFSKGIEWSNNQVANILSLPNLGSNMMSNLMSYVELVKNNFLTKEEISALYRSFYDFIATADSRFVQEDGLGKSIYDRIQALDKGVVDRNKLLSSLRLRSGGDLHFPGGTMLDYAEESEITQAWEEIIDMDEQLGTDLIRYSIMRNGFKYAPDGFSHMQPLSAWTGPFSDFFTAYKDAIAVLSRDPYKMLTYANQFIKNNYDKIEGLIPSLISNDQAITWIARDSDNKAMAMTLNIDPVQSTLFFELEGSLFKVAGFGQDFTYYERTPAFGSKDFYRTFQEYNFLADPDSEIDSIFVDEKGLNSALREELIRDAAEKNGREISRAESVSINHYLDFCK
jgi:hypothetical protein